MNLTQRSADMVERNSPGPAGKPGDERQSAALAHVEEALRGLQYGQVTVIVQDGVVVQIEKTERRRFTRSGRRT
jgi:hypothetical protein